MRKRTVKTTKILVVALTAVAGCAKPSAAPMKADPVRASAETVPTTSVPVPVAPVESAAIEESGASARPMSNDPGLVEKADELAAMGHARALTQMARFRPVCDAEGFPLVGNVIRKGPSPREEVKAFCAAVRRRERGNG